VALVQPNELPTATTIAAAASATGKVKQNILTLHDQNQHTTLMNGVGVVRSLP
jgi:hypothetical protein